MTVKNKRMQRTAPTTLHGDAVLKEETPFAVKEAYKALRTNIMLSMTGMGCKVVQVTSSQESEGKSTTALNLALVLAENSSRVLLMDCDLRAATAAQKLKALPRPGLSNYLAHTEKGQEEATIQQLACGIDLLPAGDLPPNPSEMLGSQEMAKLITLLRERYDYIILDTPPVNIVTDAMVLSRLTDGIVVVARADVANKEAVRRALRSFHSAGVRVLGVVLNGKKIERKRDYGYGHYDKQAGNTR